jgi:hypothetical protein
MNVQRVTKVELAAAKKIFCIIEKQNPDKSKQNSKKLKKSSLG